MGRIQMKRCLTPHAPTPRRTPPQGEGKFAWGAGSESDVRGGADAAPAHLDILFRQVIVDDFGVALTAALEGNPIRTAFQGQRFTPKPATPKPSGPLTAPTLPALSHPLPSWAAPFPCRWVPLTLASARSRSCKVPLVFDLMSSSASTWKSGVGVRG